MLIFQTANHWDEHLWSVAEPIYTAAFPPSTSKKPTVIRSMLRRQICFLHIAQQNDQTVAMAISAKDKRYNALVIDYLAVATASRGQGVGGEFLERIGSFATDEQQLDSMIIEVEAEPTEINAQRIRFWERCGFTLTDYLHSYIWVPEAYRAMYRLLKADAKLPAEGKALFRAITDFHKKAYRS